MMLRLFRNWLLILLPLVFLASCLEDLEFPPEPEITFVKVSKTQLNQFDSFTMTVGFKDGDGDLGYSSDVSRTCGNNVCDFTSDSSCFLNPIWSAILIDMRDSCYVLPYILPDLEQRGRVKSILGEIDLLVPPVFCKNFGCTVCDTDTLVYMVILKDRAQNLSNPVLSDTIFINCL
jgi:hypothetical protein